MNGIDTNIWIYSHDTRDPRKQQIAKQVIATARPLALVWQVGCEFIAAGRKLVHLGFTEDMAWDSLQDMRNAVDIILLPAPRIWDDARVIPQRLGLSFWDALLVASSIDGGVTTLYSEDFGSLKTVDSPTIVNPFATP